MDQLLVALDVDTAAEARALANALRGLVGGFKIGSRLFTSQGPSIVEELAAREAADDESARRSTARPLLVAVTVLTSLSNEALFEMGIPGDAGELVGRLAALAQAAGLDGVVASPQEIGLIRRRCGQSFAIVTPGIRSAGAVKGDQSRTMTGQDALAAGATYLVVGRPIIAAADPRIAAEQFVMECRAAETP